MYIKFFFIFCATLLFILLSSYKILISKKERTQKTASFVSFMGAILLLYVLSGILFAVFAPDIISKFVIAFFAISPFIIGKMATYPKENFYSYLQIFCIIASIIYSFIV